MVIAGVVITTVPGKAPFVAASLAQEEGVKLVGGDGRERIAAVVQRATGEELERWAESLVAEDERVLGVFPTFVGADPA
jgi:hypothetical protein